MSRRRELRVDITGSSASGVKAITTMQRNLKNLSRTYKDLSRHVDFLDRKLNKGNTGVRKSTKTMRAFRGQMSWLTRNMKAATSEIRRFEGAWRKGFVDAIEKSGMSLDEFNRKQGEKDASMNKNVQAANKATGSIQTFRDMVGKAQDKLSSWGIGIRTAGNRLVGLGRQLSSAGRQMVFFAGILAGTTREMVGDLGDFATVLNDIQGAMLINTDGTEDLGATFNNLRAEMVRVGEAYNFSEKEMAELTQAMVSGGLSGSQALELLEKSAMFARANMLDMNEAGELIIRTMAGMGYETGNVIDMMDVLTVVNAQSTESLDSIRAAFGFSLASAEKFTGSQNQVIAAIVHLVKTGESATVVGRRIQMMFQNLATGSEKLGFSVSNADGNFASFFEIMDRLAIKVSEFGDETERSDYIAEAFGVNQVNTVVKLLAAKDALKGMEEQLTGVSGTTQQLSDIHMKGFEESVTEARSTWKDFMLDIEESIVGPLQGLLDQFEALIENEELKKFISDLAGAFSGVFVTSLGEAVEAMIGFLGTMGITGEEAGEGLGKVAAAGLVLGPGLLGLGMVFEALGGSLNIFGSALGGVGSWQGMGVMAALGLLANFLKSDEGAPYLDDLTDAAESLVSSLTQEGGLVPVVMELVDSLAELLGPVIADTILTWIPVIEELTAALATVLGWINRVIEGLVQLTGGEMEAREETERRVRLEMQKEYRETHPGLHGRGGESVPINEEELATRITEERLRQARQIKEEGAGGGYVGGGAVGGALLGFKLGGPMGALVGALAGIVIGSAVAKQKSEEERTGDDPGFWVSLGEALSGMPPGGQHGGKVKQGGFARIHKDEQLLTPTQQQNIQQGLMGGGGDITIHLTVDSAMLEGDPQESGQRLGEGIVDGIMARSGRSMR